MLDSDFLAAITAAVELVNSVVLLALALIAVRGQRRTAHQYAEPLDRPRRGSP